MSWGLVLSSNVHFFAAPKKEPKKGAFFYEVFFSLFYRTAKNRLKSAKFLPRFQKFLTRFLIYTSVKASISSMILVEENTSIFEIPYSTFEIHKVFQKSQINILQSPIPACRQVQSISKHIH